MTNENPSSPTTAPAAIEPKRCRYQTYVFDTEAQGESCLGPEFQGWTPKAWYDGHALRVMNELQDFVESARDGKFSDLEVLEKDADALLDRLVM